MSLWSRGTSFALLCLGWFHVQLQYLVTWWEDSVLGAWEETVKTSLREAFAATTRFINGVSTWFVSFYQKDFRESLRQSWVQPQDWQKWWQEDRQSTLNAIVARRNNSLGRRDSGGGPSFLSRRSFEGASLPQRKGKQKEVQVKGCAAIPRQTVNQKANDPGIQTVANSMVEGEKRRAVALEEHSSKTRRAANGEPGAKRLRGKALNCGQGRHSPGTHSAFSSVRAHLAGSRSVMFEQHSGWGVMEVHKRTSLLEDIKIHLELAVTSAFDAVRWFVRTLTFSHRPEPVVAGSGPPHHLEGRLPRSKSAHGTLHGSSASPVRDLNPPLRKVKSFGRLEGLTSIPPKILHESSVAEIIRRAGYPVEVHHVATEDGYLLRMERIPRHSTTEVVFFMHGVFDTSMAWVSAGVTGSQAFAAWDAGFDVWLGNSRCNPPRAHVDPAREGLNYWRYTLNELGIYDMTAQLDHVHLTKCAELGHTEPLLDALNMENKRREEALGNIQASTRTPHSPSECNLVMPLSERDYAVKRGLDYVAIPCNPSLVADGLGAGTGTTPQCQVQRATSFSCPPSPFLPPSAKPWTYPGEECPTLDSEGSLEEVVPRDPGAVGRESYYSLDRVRTEWVKGEIASDEGSMHDDELEPNTPEQGSEPSKPEDVRFESHTLVGVGNTAVPGGVSTELPPRETTTSATSSSGEDRYVDAVEYLEDPEARGWSVAAACLRSLAAQPEGPSRALEVAGGLEDLVESTCSTQADFLTPAGAQEYLQPSSVRGWGPTRKGDRSGHSPQPRVQDLRLLSGETTKGLGRGGLSVRERGSEEGPPFSSSPPADPASRISPFPCRGFSPSIRPTGPGFSHGTSSGVAKVVSNMDRRPSDGLEFPLPERGSSKPGLGISPTGSIRDPGGGCADIPGQPVMDSPCATGTSKGKTSGMLCRAQGPASPGDSKATCESVSCTGEATPGHEEPLPCCHQPCMTESCATMRDQGVALVGAEPEEEIQGDVKPGASAGGGMGMPQQKVTLYEQCLQTLGLRCQGHSEKGIAGKLSQQEAAKPSITRFHGGSPVPERLPQGLRSDAAIHLHNDSKLWTSLVATEKTPLRGLSSSICKGGEERTHLPLGSGDAEAQMQDRTTISVARGPGGVHCCKENGVPCEAGSGSSSPGSCPSEPYNLQVVAHSLGGASMLIYMVMRYRSGMPHHVNRLLLLTPAGFHSAIPSIGWPLVWAIPIIYKIGKFFWSRLAGALYLPTFFIRLLTFKFTIDLNKIPALGELARLGLRALLSGDASEWDRAIQMPHYSAESMPAVSLHQALHLIQLVNSGEFKLFDYGSEEVNKTHYGSPTPPNIADEYWRIQIPVDLMAGVRDGVIPPSNVQKHYEKMKAANVPVKYQEFDFGHLDFTFSAKDELRYQIMSRLLKSSRRGQ